MPPIERFDPTKFDGYKLSDVIEDVYKRRGVTERFSLEEREGEGPVHHIFWLNGKDISHLIDDSRAAEKYDAYVEEFSEVPLASQRPVNKLLLNGPTWVIWEVGKRRKEFLKDPSL